MTICIILAAINSAKTTQEVTALYENALPVYAFDTEESADIIKAAQAATYRLTHPKAEPQDISSPDGLVTELVASCIQEPRGEHGLEGYQRGESYRCQMIEPIYPTPRYYRIYPGEPAEYYECAVPRIFTRYFHVEETSS